MDSIVMLETRLGSPDGMRSFRYLAGEVYPQEGVPLSPDLSAVFIREGWAVLSSELVSPEAEAAARETADDGPSEPHLCGVMTSRGVPCRNHVPCRWHS